MTREQECPDGDPLGCKSSSERFSSELNLAVVILGIAGVCAFISFLVLMKLQRSSGRPRQGASPAPARRGRRIQRLPPNCLAHLSTRRVVTEEDIREQFQQTGLPSRSGSVPTCVVCLCGIEQGEEAITTQCGHVFHSSCVIRWWTRRRLRSIRCPVCRQKQSVRRQARESAGGSNNSAALARSYSSSYGSSHGSSYGAQEEPASYPHSTFSVSTVAGSLTTGPLNASQEV
jgi:hypothetical protein